MKSLFAALVLSVLAFGQCTTNVAPKITSANVIAFTEASAGSFTVTATGTPTPVISEVGTLPAGVTFSAGKLSGTPSLGTAGSYTLSFSAQNGTAPDASQSFTLTVLAAQTAGFWIPALNTSWQWQIGAQPNFNNLLSVQMYDVDGENTSAANVASLHTRGIKAVCYFSAGTYENWRSDANQFPISTLGRNNGWPGEKYADYRSDAVKAIMSARMQSCKAKGFDAVEADNVDIYTANTGFPLTAATQITYNRWLADTAHSFGLSIALKNDGDQINQLLPYFDFAIEEECVVYGECSTYKPFVAAGKAVFAAEYKNRSNTCSTLNADNFNGAIFDLDLTGKRTACR